MKDRQLFLKILRKHIKPSNKTLELNWDNTLTELGIDTMSLPHLILDIEQQFYLIIPDEDLNEKTFATVNTLWSAIEKIKS